MRVNLELKALPAVARSSMTALGKAPIEAVS